MPIVTGFRPPLAEKRSEAFSADRAHQSIAGAKPGMIAELEHGRGRRGVAGGLEPVGEPDQRATDIRQGGPAFRGSCGAISRFPGSCVPDRHFALVLDFAGHRTATGLAPQNVAARAPGGSGGRRPASRASAATAPPGTGNPIKIMASLAEIRRRAIIPLVGVGVAAYYLMVFLPLDHRAKNLDVPLEKAWQNLTASLERPKASAIDFGSISNQLAETREALARLAEARTKTLGRMETSDALQRFSEPVIPTAGVPESARQGGGGCQPPGRAEESGHRSCRFRRLPRAYGRDPAAGVACGLLCPSSTVCCEPPSKRRLARSIISRLPWRSRTRRRSARIGRKSRSRWSLRHPAASALRFLHALPLRVGGRHRRPATRTFRRTNRRCSSTGW